MKKSILNTPAFRYIFEIIVIVFSVSLSFYIQDVLNDREKIEQKNKGLEGVLIDLKKDLEFFKFGEIRLKNSILYIDTLTSISAIITNKIFEESARRYFGFIGQDRNYTSMISTGSIEYIDNKDLAETIHLYYGRTYDLIKDVANQDEMYYNDIGKYIHSKYRLESLRINEKDSTFQFIYNKSILKKISIDQTIRNLLLQKKWVNLWYLKTVNILFRRNKELKKLIEIELEID